MAEIKHREDNPIPGVEYSEIRIPDEYDLGTGEYTTMVPEKGLLIYEELPEGLKLQNVDVIKKYRGQGKQHEKT